MADSGNDVLQVPGFNGVPLTFELPWAERFAHGINDYGQVPAVTAREFAMTATMNVITDRPGWSEDILIHNEEAIALWKAKAFQTEALMSEKAWDWCLAELHDKALEFRNKQFIRVLDTGSCVCKTDTMIDASVKVDLQNGLRSLNEGPHPIDGTHLAIDPFSYPLVYGETRVLDRGVVPFPRSISDMDDMLIDSSRSVRAAHQPPFDTIDPEAMSRVVMKRAGQRRKGSAWDEDLQETDPSEYFWSAKYQCLPFDTKFEETGTDLRITSYANNLHPEKQGVYRALEVITAASVRLWNETLIKNQPVDLYDGTPWALSNRQRGRYPLRILTFGVEWRDVLPSWAAPFMTLSKDGVNKWQDAKSIAPRSKRPLNISGVDEVASAYRTLECEPSLEGLPLLTEVNEETWKLAEEYLGRTLEGPNDHWLIENELCEEAARRRSWVHPEPGVAFTYEDWTAGRNFDKANVNMIVKPLGHDYHETERGLPLHDRYDLALEDTFRHSGLQLIAKAGTLYTSPDHVGSTDWRLDGHLNEHIVGVACYAYEVVNVNCDIAFAQETLMNPDSYRFKGAFETRCVRDDPDSYHFDPRYNGEDLDALAAILGFEDGNTLESIEDHPKYEMPMQEIGTISLPEGRLIAFPSVVEHTLQASLIDPTLKGHVRYILLYLVDPHYRICSTSNVPPQQHDWWTAAVREVLLKTRLPGELVDHILSFYEPPMSHEHAKEHHKAMQQEAASLEVARHVRMYPYDFCLREL